MANPVPWALSHTQIAVELVATIAFALSGVIEGARKRLDAVGICVVAGLAGCVPVRRGAVGGPGGRGWR